MRRNSPQKKTRGEQHTDKSSFFKKLVWTLFQGIEKAVKFEDASYGILFSPFSQKKNFYSRAF